MKNHLTKNIILVLAAILMISGAGYLFLLGNAIVRDRLTATSTGSEYAATANAPKIETAPDNPLFPPISSALSRVTKKPFGIKVSPDLSPVSPERFSGYHTGVDFETAPEEQKIDVPISAICTGTLMMKKTATGYGGVAVEKCILDKETITVIYGHLKYSSILASIGQKIPAGGKIGILGKGYSSETDGERKHLHLGIHKGDSLNILGYVQNKNQLTDWLDITKFLK